MKRITALSLSLFAITSAFAQQKTTDKVADAKKDKCIISGTIRNIRKMPVAGVEAFVYKADSSIVASGTTDATGHFETNSVMPGDYTVKMVFPNRQNMMVTGITIKKPGNTIIDFKGDAPAADTTVAYSVLAPQPAPKAAAKKK